MENLKFDNSLYRSDSTWNSENLNFENLNSENLNQKHGRRGD
jgi:hypothetical protein